MEDLVTILAWMALEAFDGFALAGFIFAGIRASTPARALLYGTAWAIVERLLIFAVLLIPPVYPFGFYAKVLTANIGNGVIVTSLTYLLHSRRHPHRRRTVRRRAGQAGQDAAQPRWLASLLAARHHGP